MAARIDTRKPSWMLDEPELIRKRFHNIEIEVWAGDVPLDAITGWIGNPRTELHAEQFTNTYGRPPTNEEMYQLVLADNEPNWGLKIKELASNIYKNGVRAPIVLRSDRRLLDGNRRYYACMFLTLEGAPKAERNRFKRIPAIVLPPHTTKEVEDAIMTEFNFADDFRLLWVYYVRAMRVHEDYVGGLGKEELEIKYALPWRILYTWIRAAEHCERFLSYHEHNYLAKRFAYYNFIMFDEMTRRYKSRLDKADFRDSVFDLLLAEYPDNHRFRAASDVIRLPEIRDNAEAWDALTSRKGPEALKDALRILEVSTFDSVADTNARFRRLVRGLEKLGDSGGLKAVDSDILDEFYIQAERVPGGPTDPATQIEKMIKWLDRMTSLQISELGRPTLSNLRKALERVLKMAEAVADEQPKKPSVARSTRGHASGSARRTKR
jgi:hypothetical protein